MSADFRDLFQGLFLWAFLSAGSLLPELGGFLGEVLMPSLPGEMLGHVIVAVGLTAVLALFVQRCLPATLGTWLDQRLPGPRMSKVLCGLRLSLSCSGSEALFH